VAFEMIDCQVRFAKADCQTLGDGRANHERTRQARSAGGRKCIDFRQIDLGLACSVIEQPRRIDQMIARRNLRHDPAEFFMRGNLRCDFAGKQLVRVIVASTQDRDGGFIARRFKG